jgi:hypothetical protein
MMGPRFSLHHDDFLKGLFYGEPMSFEWVAESHLEFGQ